MGPKRKKCEGSGQRGKKACRDTGAEKTKVTSSTQSGFVDSWQRGKSVTECNLHMLETEDFTDVTFLVGSEKHVVRAHRYVLASRSCVFHAMFCGQMAEQGEINIPDIETNIFKDFLRFLYTDTCTISSENVAGLLYTSRKYDVETLLSESETYIEQELSEENLCEILEKSHGYGETNLEQNTLKLLSQAGPKLTKSAGFVNLCSGCFGTFLKSRNLNVKEDKVFEAALSWTRAECERESLSPSHENMRKILGEMVYEIRFASLSLEFLTKVVGPSGILTGDERVNVMDRILEPSNDISPFKSDQRRIMVQHERKVSSNMYYVKRFSTILQPSNQDCYHGISFSTKKNITLLGCQLYGSVTEQTTRLDIHLRSDQYLMYPVRNTDFTLRDDVNDIMFPNPVSIQSGRVYHILVQFSENVERYSGAGGVSAVCADGVEFTFSKVVSIVCNSSVEEGQIPGLIWRY